MLQYIVHMNLDQKGPKGAVSMDLLQELDASNHDF